MIRKAKASDLKRISVIFRAEFKNPPYNEKWPEKLAIKKLRNYYKNNHIFVVESEKQIVGFLIGQLYTWHDGTRGLIDELVVSSKFQGKGYGTKLIMHFEKFLKKNGIKKLNLFSVTKSKAFKLYKKLGFKKEDFVSMTKTLK